MLTISGVGEIAKSTSPATVARAALAPESNGRRFTLTPCYLK
jgi:hypothetical protein